MANGADGEAEGGEAACSLPLVGENGAIVDPRSLVTLASEDKPDQHVRVVGIGRGAPLEVAMGHLAPRADETAEAYRERLETPVCRTAAWSLVLAAGDEPIAIKFADEAERERHGPILISYLRSLIE